MSNGYPALTSSSESTPTRFPRAAGWDSRPRGSWTCGLAFQLS